MSLTWSRPEGGNPNDSTYQAQDEDHPGTTYVAKKSKNGTGLWRLAVRGSDSEPLRIIYVGNTLAECREYAEVYRTAAQQ